MASLTKNFWPSARQFAEAVQCPAVCFNEPTLRTMLPAVDRLGMPLVTSGQFAYVFKLNTPDGAGDSLAVRCFRGFLGDREARYRALDSHLNTHRVAALPRFKYLPKGVLVAGQRFPILVMEWVAGPTLDVYVEETLGRGDVLRHLADEWLRLMESLRAAEVAHGDLQHGNVIVERGRLRLVDLDGAYVPALAGQCSSEVGHQHFQHPARDAEFFSSDVDNFPALVVYLSLIALAERPKLWAEHHDENLIFTRADFKDPEASALFRKVREMGAEHARLSDALAEAAKSDVSKTPWLLDLVQVKSRLPAWMTAPVEVDVVGRTREAARVSVVQGAGAAATWEPRATRRRAPAPLSSNTVQTLFGAQTASASSILKRSGAPLDPSDIFGNTFRYAGRGAGQSFAYLWWIPFHNIIMKEFWFAAVGFGATASTTLTLLFITAAFIVYGFLRALNDSYKATQTGVFGGAAPTLPPRPVSAVPVAGTKPPPPPLFAHAQSPAPAAAPSVPNLIGNRRLNIYHRPACAWAHKIAQRNRTPFDNPAHAQSAGYRPCRVCQP